MNAKEKLLLAIHRSFRKDRWINELFHAAGISFDEIQQRLQEIDDQNFIDTATWGLKLYEKDLGIITKKTTSIENRRAEIEARWKTDNKIDIEILQRIADSWENGETIIQFKEGRIKISFVSARGIPEEIDSLKRALEIAKPAHLPIDYIFNYMTWAEFDDYDKTWFEWDKLHLNWIEFERYKEEIPPRMTWRRFDKYEKTWQQWDGLELTWRELERYYDDLPPRITWLEFEAAGQSWQAFEEKALTWRKFERYRGKENNA